MAKRDPEKTARNKIINDLSFQLKALLPTVLKDTKIVDEYSLHGKFGGKYANYIDVKNTIIYSPEHFISLYFEGFESYLDTQASPNSKHFENYELFRKHSVLREYLYIFFKRTYLRNYDALSKKRPTIEDSELYIGQNNANYGLLITPRFENGKWENDRSEIRHFNCNYWSIGHVLKTGLVIPNVKQKIKFGNIEDYLNFFQNVIVRNSGSSYEYEIAEKYCEFVRKSSDPLSIPLLIPELRYNGLLNKHIYRLDFCIIDPYELTKIGFELSPWSTHGYLSKTKVLNQVQINKIAKDNFQKEMKKHRAYFNKYGIVVLIFTDDDLKNIDQLFDCIKKYLSPNKISQQLKYHIIGKYFK